MQIEAILRQVELFRGLNDTQLHELAAICRREAYHDGEVIVRWNEPGERLYLVGDGEVEVRLPGGVTSEMRSELYLGQGQIFGEVALLDEGMRSATIIAVQDNTVVFSIERDRFTALCEADTALGYLLMRNLALDLAFKLRHRNWSPGPG